MIGVPEPVAKSEDADFLRELIQDAAERLMDIEVSALFGAGHGATIVIKKDFAKRINFNLL